LFPEEVLAATITHESANTIFTPLVITDRQTLMTELRGKSHDTAKLYFTGTFFPRRVSYACFMGSSIGGAATMEWFNSFWVEGIMPLQILALLVTIKYVISSPIPARLFYMCMIPVTLLIPGSDTAIK
jgi:hypothetical protein